MATAAAAAATTLGVRAGQSFNEYSRALAEVSTLIEGTEDQLELLDNSAKTLASTFGGTATQQVQAFYQAISAGAGSVEEANLLLEQSNVLAVAGVTDVITATRALSSALNAYERSGLTAAEASDILFSGVKAGVTTVAELQSGLSDIVPIASQIGISYTETTAALAALTTVSANTATSSTQLRSVFNSLLKPSGEARRFAEELTLEFNTQALASRGLAGFLADVAEKTGGSAEQMTVLFGSAEAANAVISLTGSTAEAFSDTLEDMASAAGAATEAANKVSQSLSQRLRVALGDLGTKMLEIGEAILTVVVPALEVLVDLLNAIGIERLGFYFGAFAILIAGRYVTSMDSAVRSTKAFSRSLYVLRTALIRTGIGAVSVVVGELAFRFYELVSGTNTTTKSTDQLTNAIGDEIRQSNLLQTALQQSNLLSLDAARLKLQEAQARYASVNAIIAEYKAHGLASEEYKRLGRQIESLRESTPEGEVFGHQSGAIAERQEALANLLIRQSSILEVPESFTGELRRTGQQIEELEEIIKSGEEALKSFTGQLVEPIVLGDRDFSKVISGGSSGSFIDSIDELSEKTNTLADNLASAFTSIVTGSESARDAIGNLAKSIADSLIKSGFQSLFSSILPVGLSSFLFPSAKGNAFDSGNILAFQRGGVVNRATPFGLSGGRLGIAGEAGPEAILPLSRGSDGNLGVRAQGGVGGSSNNVTVNYSIDARGADVEAINRLRIEQQRNTARLKYDVYEIFQELRQDRIL